MLRRSSSGSSNVLCTYCLLAFLQVYLYVAVRTTRRNYGYTINRYCSARPRQQPTQHSIQVGKAEYLSTIDIGSVEVIIYTGIVQRICHDFVNKNVFSEQVCLLRPSVASIILPCVTLHFLLSRLARSSQPHPLLVYYTYRSVSY